MEERNKGELRMKKIIIYGTGSCCNRFLDKILDGKKVKIKAFMESVKSKSVFRNVKVIEPNELDEEYDLMIVCSSFIEEIQEIIVKNNISLTKCIFTTDGYNYFAYSGGYLVFL